LTERETEKTISEKGNGVIRNTAAHSSVGPIPSSYTISLDNCLNLEIDFWDNVPYRISFNMSTNSEAH
jgi:hypothetical protein